MTEEGIEIFFNEVHPIKEWASIVFIKEGYSKVTSSSDEQNEKQFCLIEVTETFAFFKAAASNMKYWWRLLESDCC